jgi:hypothetical protein
LRDPVYRDGLTSWLGEFKAKSVLILDEAHHAAPASGSRYAVDSDFTYAIRGIAGRFEVNAQKPVAIRLGRGRRVGG